MIPATDPTALPSAEWFELKGRLFRFFGVHPGWARWQNPEGAWICGLERERDLELARDARIAALLKDPRLLPSRAIPERHAFADVTSSGWNRLFLGVFTYLGGPARLDAIVDVAALMLHLPSGSPVVFPSPLAEHVSYEQMDAMVENTLDAAALASVMAHSAECAFCARQQDSYREAALHLAASIQKPKPAQ